MSTADPFSGTDLEQLARHGISREEAERQLDLLGGSAHPSLLSRPCTVGDGIVTLPPDRHAELETAWDDAAGSGRLLKFVPASGAATRMFGSLSRFHGAGQSLPPRELQRRAAEGASDAGELLAFLEHLKEFAFMQQLAETLHAAGLDLARLRSAGDYLPILGALLDRNHLGYADLPKGLIPFHPYPEGPRTAFEEQMVEGTGYLVDREGRCRFHFTVSPGHLERFRVAREATRGRRGGAWEIALSTQSPSTDTLAVDLNNRPARRGDESLLLRPGGHGALLANLARIDGDVVLIKNIDNVVPEPRQQPIVAWKRLLAGYLVLLQREIFDHLDRLQAGGGPQELVAARRFVEERLGLRPPRAIAGGADAGLRAYLLDRLDRPLRVCGMVENRGEPGGGPFWVLQPDGGSSPQIVESSQVDASDAGQAAIWGASTHFNPVDLVCGLRDRAGRPYDLRRFVDPATALIGRKRYRGKELKVLEHPGLWNGAMAGWNTVFVEVPLATFAPVKTVIDLLAPTHRVPRE